MKTADWGVLRWLGILGLFLTLGLCVAGYFGMGGWSKALPIAPPSALAHAPAVDRAPLSEPPIDSALIAQYSLFSPQRGPDMQSFTTPTADAESASAISQDWVLASMMITPLITVAVMLSPTQQAIRVRLGDTLPGGVLSFTRAEPRAAILSGPSGERRLELRTYTGRIGEAAPVNVSSKPSEDAPMRDSGQVSPAPTSLRASPETPELTPEEAMRQRLGKRRAELEQQNNQGSNPL